MYLRLYQFTLQATYRSSIAPILDKVLTAVRAESGCEHCEFFIDTASGDCGFVILWTSQQALEAAAPRVFSILTPVLALAAAAPSIRLFEVYPSRP